MAKVVADPPTMVGAASRLRLVAEDLQAVAGFLRAAELPAMPAEMAAGYSGPLQAIAARVAAIPEPLLETAEKLLHRAEIAQTATELEVDTSAGHRVAAALEGARGDGAAPDAPVAPGEPGAAAALEGQASAGGAPAEGVQAAVDAPAGAYAGGPDSPAHEGLRASHADVLGNAPAAPVPEADAAQKDWACWMASQAAHDDVPPSLPIALALAGSGMNNLDEHDGNVGFFALRPGEDVAPPGFGVGPASQPDADWWRENPEAQLDHVLRSLKAVAPEDAGEADPARWAAEAQPHVGEGDVSDAMSVARTLVARCRYGIDGPGDGDGDGGEAVAAGGGNDFVKAVKSQLGVAETGGANAGPEVDTYLQAASVGSGNPWCASFLTWAMRETGAEMPGTGWAAVATWVNAAESGTAGLRMVSPEEARPGDIVCYDWGGDGDFAADGHIGMLESTVEGGRFTAIEGNAEDAVTRMERSMGEGKVVFLRRGE